MKNHTKHHLWGSAFTEQPSDVVVAFTAGRDVVGLPASDISLLPYDVWCNQAHTVMLAKTGIISGNDAAAILVALSELEMLVQNNMFTLDPSQEDVHTNIECWLTQKLGIEIAGKIHTARSRNDQVLTDMKLYMRDQVLVCVEHALDLVAVLLTLANEYAALPMPGFTHHQHAMVTTFGHILAGFASMVLRDIERLKNWYVLHNQSPLGDAASYGTSMPIDRKMTSTMLAFDGADHNSVDAITNRSEPEADLAFSLVTLMNHLSTISETFILLGTQEFGMITISDGYSTGSSIMPQKKNPDPLEVIKGKASYAHGQLVSLLSLGKGTFIGYNRDSQWGKYIIMDLLRECQPAPIVLAGVLDSMTIHADVMKHWSHKGFIGAATLMEQLVSQYKIPMRIAKMVVEKAVKYSAESEVVTFDALTRALAEDNLALPITEKDVQHFQDPNVIISLTKSYGGAGKKSMKSALKIMRKKMFGDKQWLMVKQKEKVVAKEMLKQMIEGVISPPSLKLQGMKGGENI